MSNLNPDAQALVTTSGPQTIKINVKGHPVYEVNKQVLIDASPYFRSMFNGGFLENTTGVVELPDQGDHIGEAFWILLQIFEKGEYSMRDYIAEKKVGQDRLSEPDGSFWWLVPLALTLRLHELWLDLFVLVDQYGSKEACAQVVADISNILAISMTLEPYKTLTFLPYSLIHPIVINAPKFCKMHYDRVVMRMQGNYPLPLHGIWLRAFHSFCRGGQLTQDRSFFRMADENQSLAVSALPAYASMLDPKYVSGTALLEVTDRQLYALLNRVIKDNWDFVIRRRLENLSANDEFPKWYLDWSWGF